MSADGSGETSAPSRPALRKKRRERREVGAELSRRTRELVLFAFARLREIFAGHGITRTEDVAHAGDASVCLAEGAAARKSIGDHRVLRGVFAETEERA